MPRNIGVFVVFPVIAKVIAGEERRQRRPRQAGGAMGCGVAIRWLGMGQKNTEIKQLPRTEEIGQHPKQHEVRHCHMTPDAYAVEEQCHPTQHDPAMRALEVAPDELDVPEDRVVLVLRRVIRIIRGGRLAMVLQMLLTHHWIQKQRIQKHRDRANGVVQPRPTGANRLVDCVVGGDEKTRVYQRPKRDRPANKPHRELGQINFK